jgi:hypothetical protein
MEIEEASIEKITNFFSGALSSGISTMLFYPLENIKTSLQLSFYKKQQF